MRMAFDGLSGSLGPSRTGRQQNWTAIVWFGDPILQTQLLQHTGRNPADAASMHLKQGPADYGKRSPNGERFMSHESYIRRKKFEEAMASGTI